MRRFNYSNQPHQWWPYYLAVAALLCLVFTIGCGPQPPRLVPVTGRVQVDGQPVTAGSIAFFPDSNAEYTEDNPSSLLQLDGSFTMKTFPFGEGVAPGDYTATLAPELASRLNKELYASPTKSPWKITVPPEGLSELILEVD